MLKKYYLFIILFLLLITGCKTKTYTITLKIDNDTLQTVNVIKGDNLKDIDTPEKEGYIFVSWLKDGIEYDIENPTFEDLTLTANWIEEPVTSKKFTVTFDFGEYTKTKTINEGEILLKPSDPVIDGYKFLGWYYQDSLYDFQDKVTKDFTITAKYQKINLKITYNLNGGSGTKETENSYGSIPTKPKSPTKFGYNFSKWLINDQEYNFDTPLYEDTIITAKWTAKEYYRVTFDSAGGSAIPSEIVEKNYLIKTTKIPQKEGYVFKYWSYNDMPFNLNTKITKNITLIAIYEKIS